jgi:F-type H+-transporting ATPase subunit delta
VAEKNHRRTSSIKDRTDRNISDEGMSQVSSNVIGATGLSGRYATALFELADEEKALDDVASDLASVGVMIEESDDLQRLIRSPIISRDDQLGAMDAVLEAAGVGQLTRNFIGVVTRNRRLFALPGMIKDYQTLLAAARGEATAEVTSAQQLSDAQISAVEDSIKQAMGTKVAIDAKVDESLLGGLVVKVGSRMVDTSLKTKLSQLRLAMKGVG